VGALRGAGLRPCALDLPGHGAEPDAPDAFTLDGALTRVLRHMPPTPVPVAGYSMGARLALALAARHPARVSRLVLESGSPGLATEEERAARRASDERLAGDLERDGIGPFVDGWERLPLFAGLARRLSDEERAEVRRRRLSHDPHELAAALRGLGTGSLPSFWDDLARLDLPVLLLVGAEDHKFVGIAEAMAARLKRATLHVVPDAGHTVHLEQPGRWLESVLGFLTEGA